MKEFIEKLIERLRKEAEEHREHWKEFVDDDSFGGMNATMRAIKIVNELAEEYSANTPQKSEGGWISVTERLPDNKTSVLICSGEFVHEAYFEDGNFSNDYGMWYKSVTHWQPLPEPYESEKPAEWKDAVMNHFTKIE